MVALALTVLLTIQTLNRQWSTDYWLHQAVVDSLRSDLFHPGHPLTGSGVPSENYSPYTVVLGALASVTGWASVVVLQCAAIVNLVLFLVAFRLFVVELIGHRRVAVYALVATLVFWGPRSWRWSGFLNLNSIGFGLPYPSMFATGLALLVGWALLRYDATRSRRWLVLVGLGLPTLALTHPFTALWTLVMLVALGIHRRIVRRETIGPLLLTAAGAFGVAAVWPYYPFFELATAGDRYAGAHAPLYQDLPLRLFAALPGFVVVLGRFRRDRTDPLGLMLLGGATLYAVGPVLGAEYFGRVLPLILLSAHIGLGVLLDNIIEHRRWRSPVAAWVAASAAIGLVGAAPGLVRMLPRAILPASVRENAPLRPITQRFTALQNALEPGTVAVAEHPSIGKIAPAYGIRVLVPAYATAFIDDVEERQDAARAILNPTTDPARRARLTQRYGIGAVLCSTEACRRLFSDDKVVLERPWIVISLATPSRRS